ncbi:MAG TPA: MFS transporter, partial [Phycisphaerae bacterium]|nr:MFS transporter [Phycisphaerae bacterium]
MTSSPTPQPGAPVLEYRRVPELTNKMPKGILFIVANEFAERFSFYGMSAILVVFMTKYMVHRDGSPDHLTRDQADIWFHNFTTFVYFTPILGALIADIFWGKYNTILWISLLYCLGHGTLALGETRYHLVIGLTLIGMGAGGIKPCVSANVGDQFGKNNEHLLAKIYNWFYFSINLGAFLAQMMIPVLLDKFGSRVAFAVPGILMAIAAFVFWLGRHKYVHRPPQGWAKVRENFTGENLKILLRLVVFFIFAAPFYALYYQASGAWVDQAEKLDLNLYIIPYKLLQSQVQAINAVLILIFIPIFAYGIYPLAEKFVKLTPKRKIGAGMIVVMPAFAIAAYLEKEVSAGNHPSVWWQLLGYTIITAAEILVSVPALEFAYTQAPKKMKSLIMASYLAGSISLGNFIAARIIGVMG